MDQLALVEEDTKLLRKRYRLLEKTFKYAKNDRDEPLTVFLSVFGFIVFSLSCFCSLSVFAGADMSPAWRACEGSE